MPEERMPDRGGLDGAPRVGESQSDYRQRMVQIQAEAIERRQHEISEQRSPQHAPADRIRRWERLHQLSLPTNPAHRLINVIATATDLSLEEVQTEQRERAAARTPAKGVT